MLVEHLLDIELVTPRRIEYAGKAKSVSCPGTQGRFQVLYNHAPLLASLGVGILAMVDEAEQRHVFAISGGVTQVFRNRVRILADTAEASTSIDVLRASSAKERAEQRLKLRDEAIDHERAQAALLRAMNRLKAADIIE